MKLYYVLVGDEERSAVVRAGSPEEAMRFGRDYYFKDEPDQADFVPPLSECRAYPLRDHGGAGVLSWEVV
jgi:hypothetical protein